ncbi:hypothetical protein FEK35_25515 [Nocardia cyriacigeorgica]|uniref:Uncharacterized protein n=1 Tax=Nocardia cyriacigeorgica TaxID=135487 RepID=A0A5R8P714_9NOCA|nr:hypothetical protein [Nocardia cyriacigeorgica]TLF98258.1 hypothetical protein FEK35_25515 [Nocardia cyriacigeorgica]
MAEYTLGERLRSRVSSAQFVVIRVDDSVAEIACDGVALARDAEQVEPAPAPSDGPAIEIGKRYQNEAGTLELLCVGAGSGQLSADGEQLRLKEAKPLPASD